MAGGAECEWCGGPVDLARVEHSVKVLRGRLPAGVVLPHAFEGSLVAVLHRDCWAAINGPGGAS